MTEKTFTADKESIRFAESVTAALIGVSTVIVVQLLQLTSFDIPLKIALYSFAVSIPMLTAYFVIVWLKTDYAILVDVWSETFAGVVGGGCSIVGLGAIFWHFSMPIGITFIVAGIAAFGMVAAWGNKHDRINRGSD